MYQKILVVIVIGLALFWLNLPTLHDGLFHVYDNVQVTRIQAMYSELQSGQFPVRYIDSFGHGGGTCCSNIILPYCIIWVLALCT